MDGYEVARRLRQQLGSARVVLVAITGFDHPDDRRRSAEVGFDHHLLKPIDPDSLLRLVSSLAG
jgi:CheY-like chemotaxis protein